MNNQIPEPCSLDQVIARAAEDLDADIIHYNGPIERPSDGELIEDCISRKRRNSVLMILVTEGGDPNAAYRIARCLQENYDNFMLYVSGYCKSAGTLIAIGAHELVISNHGELGPLDVQMEKKDEIVGSQSGLTVMDTMAALREHSFNSFEKFLLDLIKKSGGSISLKTSAEIATSLTTGLFSPITGQVGPLHIGEAGRAMSMAGQYGFRLLQNGKNIGLDK